MSFTQTKWVMFSKAQARITSNASGLSSTRTNRRPSRIAAAPVVPLPAKKSRTQSPGRVEAATMRRRTASGFWVGYPVFSRPVGDTMVCHHTSVGSLPRLAFAAVTRPGAM